MIITDKTAIINFMRNHAPDYKGRYHDDILSFSDAELEQCHDQIQWMFPLHEESNFAETYPIINEEIACVGREDQEVCRGLKAAADRMSRFLGIGKYHTLDEKTYWCSNRDHNLLRITRIIRCLQIFHLPEDATQFFVNASYKAQDCGFNDEMTFDYWERALKDDIWETLR